MNEKMAERRRLKAVAEFIEFLFLIPAPPLSPFFLPEDLVALKIPIVGGKNEPTTRPEDPKDVPHGPTTLPVLGYLHKPVKSENHSVEDLLTEANFGGVADAERHAVLEYTCQSSRFRNHAPGYVNPDDVPVSQFI